MTRPIRDEMERGGENIVKFYGITKCKLLKNLGSRPFMKSADFIVHWHISFSTSRNVKQEIKSICFGPLDLLVQTSDHNDTFEIYGQNVASPVFALTLINASSMADLGNESKNGNRNGSRPENEHEA